MLLGEEFVLALYGGQRLATLDEYRYYGGGGGVRGGGCENVRPENNFSKNREREITFTEIREREIRK